MTEQELEQSEQIANGRPEQVREQEQKGSQASESIEDSLPKIPKGFALFEGIIKELAFINPEKQAKRNQFLNDDDKKQERKDLLRKLEYWKDIIASKEDVSEVIQTALAKSQIAETQLKKNVKKALDHARELEASYTSMDMFYKNSGEKKIKNLTIVNASIKDLTVGDDFYNLISNEIETEYERLDLKDNYSILCIPGYFGKNKDMMRWGKLAHNNKVILVTDSADEDTPDDAVQTFESEVFSGSDAFRSNVVMVANHFVMRDKHKEFGESQQLVISPASGYAGRIYATNMSQPVAGTKYGTIYNVGAVKYKLKQGELSKFDEIGLVPMVHEFGRVMPYSAKTLNNGDNIGFQTYSVVRVFDYINKVLRHFLNQRSFEKWDTSFEKNIQDQIVNFLDSIKGKDKMIENFNLKRFERDPNDKTKVYLDMTLTPYFPAKSFQITLDGHDGKDMVTKEV
jgi:Type VI secretion system, TssC, VipB